MLDRICVPRPQVFLRWLLVASLLCVLVPAATDVGAATIYLQPRSAGQEPRKIIGTVDEAGSTDDTLLVRTTTGQLRIPRSKVLRIEDGDQGGYTEQMADLAFAGGNLDRALELYQRVADAEPDNQSVREKLERVKERIWEQNERLYSGRFAAIERAIESGRYDSAIEMANTLYDRVADELTRQRCLALMARANIYIARSFRDQVDYQRAELYYQKAIQAYPEGGQALLELAEMLEATPTRRAQAIEYYQRGIEQLESSEEEVDPALVLARKYRLATLLYEVRQHTRAAELFLEVARDDEELLYPNAIDLAVTAYRNQLQPTGDLSETARIVENLKTIVQLKPREPWAHLLLGRIYFDQGNYEEARDLLAVTAEYADPGRDEAALKEALYFKALSHRELGEDLEAAALYERLVREGAANYEYEVRCDLGDIRLTQADYSNGLVLFESAIDINDERYRAYFGRGEALRRLDRYEEARESFEEVLQRDEDHLRAMMRIARTYDDEKNWDEVIRQTNRVIDKGRQLEEEAAAEGEADPEEVAERELVLTEAYTLLAEAQRSLNKTNVARDNLQKALEYTPDHAPAFNVLGKTYQDEGLHVKAQEYLLKAIEADPDNADFHLDVGINWHNYRKSTEKALPYYLRYIELGGKDPNVRIWIRECGGVPPS